MSSSLRFHSVINRWFTGKFSQPSPPQKSGWPAIAAGEHTLILAPTGSGKTLAAFLWCIDALFRLGQEKRAETFAANPDGVHTLYISPLKALNYDIHRNLQIPLKEITQFARTDGFRPAEIRVAVRTGDTSSAKRQALVKKPPHILITTPESLYLLITSKKGRRIFANLRYIIVDEIHAVSGSKRGVHLSLSLERLTALCGNEPVRIGLSATQKPLSCIAAFLGGQKVDSKTGVSSPRPVTIVDCGSRKQMDLKILAPVADYSDLPEATVWPAVYKKLYEMILLHRTTLIFVNMRAQTEKIARQLNELHQQQTGDINAEIALAHHGSISSAARFEIEKRLKTGKIPAVVATASLELGIDIGSIELVVQLESPRSVTSALQRVGRSGHLLSGKSKGRIIPLYPGDLDDAIAIVRAMQEGDIEETEIPENCLDVLAQQIAAEVSMQDWERMNLFYLVTQSYCYRHLSLTVFDSVLEMLAGKFAGAPLRTLRPRISRDKINDRLMPRRGTRLQAVMNSGTIPDRGYYSVHLTGNEVKLGDMEEEFIFESRVGDVFYFGNNEWKIDEITRDKLMVSPVKSIKPRAPFWKGGILYRDYHTQCKVGVFRRQFSADAEGKTEGIYAGLQDNMEGAVWTNLQQYFRRQLESTGKLATDRQIVVEYFRDAAGEPHAIIHAPFGSRVNGAWASALRAVLGNRYRVQVQYNYDDDGIILRLPDAADYPDINDLFHLSAQEVETALVASLSDTPLFLIHFRYNAARSLLLPRSVGGKRIPLWLQRLRAADLLQIVREIPDFPILSETYRECLEDVFDLRRLRQIVAQIRSGEIGVHTVRTNSPSPMASGLLFRFISDTLYENDRTRYPAQTAGTSRALLAEILKNGDIPSIVTPEQAAEAEKKWQFRTETSKAKDKEDLFAIIDQFGPVEKNQLAERVTGNPEKWLQELHGSGRIKYLPGLGWIAAADSRLFPVDSALSEETVAALLSRYLRTSGPVSIFVLSQKLALPRARILPALQVMEKSGGIVRGKLIDGSDEELWCERQNYLQLYRTAIGKRRKLTTAVSLERFTPFTLRWHKIGCKNQSLAEIVDRYSGFKFPPDFFEREILRSRFGVKTAEEWRALLTEFDELIRQGDVIVRTVPGSGDKGQWLEFFPRGTGNRFFSQREILQQLQKFDPPMEEVVSFLRENGASPVRDIAAGADLSTDQTEIALQVLAKNGLVTCDDYPSFVAMLKNELPGKNTSSEHSFSSTHIPASRFARGRRPGRSEIRQRVLRKAQIKQGRWFLVSSFAVYGKADRGQEDACRNDRRTLQQAKLLLRRYGVMVKEWYRRENGLMPWYPVFQAFKRLEWQGEIRRGYFVEGLSGVQYARPEAAKALANLSAGQSSRSIPAVLISVTDPALPFGGNADWNLQDRNGNRISISRLPGNHLLFLNELPILYTENYGSRLWTSEYFSGEMIETVAQSLKIWLMLPESIRPGKRIEISQINGRNAADSRFAARLIQHGYEREGAAIILWPSGV